MGKNIGNLYCGESLPVVVSFIDDHRVPVHAQAFQVYNSTKSILRPNKSAQPYHNAAITNQLATGVQTNRIIEMIQQQRESNWRKLEFLTHQDNGKIHLIDNIEIRFEGIYQVIEEAFANENGLSFAEIQSRIINPIKNLFIIENV